MKLQAKIIIMLLFIANLFTLFACSSYNEINGFSLGTSYFISCDKNISQSSIQSFLNSIEDTLSVNVLQSDIYRINHSEPNVWVEIEPSTTALIKESFEYAKMDSAQNSFNIAIFPLVELWGFAPPFFPYVDKTLPDTAEINDLLAYCKPELFEIEGNKIKRLTDKSQLDLGAIAKGYAADCLAEFLRNNNSKKALINLGGTLISYGKSSVVGIAPPRESEHSFIGSFTLESNEACATSGDYERFYSIEDKRYHHIIGLDGYPVDNELMAVTVICDSAKKADILSTFSFVEGLNAIKIIKDNGAKGILVLKDKSIIAIDVNVKIKDSSYTLINHHE